MPTGLKTHNCSCFLCAGHRLALSVVQFHSSPVSDGHFLHRETEATMFELLLAPNPAVNECQQI